MNITKEPVTLEEVNNVLELAVESGADIEEFEGVLNDSYIIRDTENVVIDEEEPTEFIIISSEYASSWSNHLYLIRTNDNKVVERYEEQFQD